MGSESLLYLIVFYFLTPSNPSDASETWQWIRVPAGAHPVDPAAECLDADASSKPEPMQQQQPTATTPIDNLALFLRLNPPVFSNIGTTWE